MEQVELVCPQCLQPSEDGKVCNTCRLAKQNRDMALHQHRIGPNWMEVAAAEGRNIWDQQPDETVTEWRIWEAYRSQYPSRKPSLVIAAEVTGANYSFVRSTSSRWSYQARLQAWIAEVNAITAAQRRQAILDMNEQHIKMAKNINKKLDVAIEAIHPEALEPKDIVALGKLATDLERKANVDTLTHDAIMRDMSNGGENPELKKQQTPKSDLADVLSILQTAGLIPQGAALGVRQTTEVVVKNE